MSINSDSLMNPLLEIGGCYVYEIKQDTIAGLLLAEIRKEEDSIYYSFLLSGKFFEKTPLVEEYRQAGLSGSEIPDFSSGSFQKAFNKYTISEKKLKPHLTKFKILDKINLSKKNQSGGGSFIDNFEKLTNEFTKLALQNIETEKQIKQMGMPIAKYAIIEWQYLLVASTPEEMVKPEVIWILSPKTAHPKAAVIMIEKWWWNPADDLSPFGNDDGADAFYIFKDWREGNKNTKSSLFIKYLQKRWGMSFSHIEKDSETDLPEIEKENTFYRNIDRAIIGLAFGQFVLEGTISPELKSLGIKAIKRTKTEFGMNGMTEGNKNEYRTRLDRMERILMDL